MKTYADECVATAETVKVYNFRVGKHGQLLDFIGDDLDRLDDLIGDQEEEGISTPSEEINKRALAYQFSHPSVDFLQAVDKVMQADPGLSRAYSGECGGKPARIYQQSNRGSDPSMEVDRLAREYMDEQHARAKEHNARVKEEDEIELIDYESAVEHVLQRHPDLNRAYGEFSTGRG